jgi:nucleotide-binding universal stress UspA family protein
MFEKIFVALETKPADHEILSCMGGLRSLGAREAHLAYFLTVNEAFAASFEVAVEGLRADLAGLKEKLEEQGFKVAARAAVASSAGEINRLIQAADASLVVVGHPPAPWRGNAVRRGNHRRSPSAGEADADLPAPG